MGKDWTPEIEEAYNEVVEDLNKGHLKWDNVSTDRVGEIGKKVSW